MNKLLLVVAVAGMLAGCAIYPEPQPNYDKHHHHAFEEVYSSNQMQPVNSPAPVWKGAAAPLFSNPNMNNMTPAANKVSPYHGKGLLPHPDKPTKVYKEQKKLLGK